MNMADQYALDQAVKLVDDLHRIYGMTSSIVFEGRLRHLRAQLLKLREDSGLQVPGEDDHVRTYSEEEVIQNFEAHVVRMNALLCGRLAASPRKSARQYLVGMLAETSAPCVVTDLNFQASIANCTGVDAFAPPMGGTPVSFTLSFTCAPIKQ